MARITSSVRALFVVAMVLACASASAAQTRRPYRSLFGPGERDEARADQFVLSMSAYSGLDDTSRFATGGVLDDQLQTGRVHQGGTMALAFLRRRPRVTVTAAGSSALRYYSSLNRIGTQKHSGGVGLNLLASRNLTFRFAQEASYSPSYQLALGHAPQQESPDVTFTPAGVDYGVGREKQITFGSAAGATYVWNSSRDLTLGYSLNYTNYFARSDFGMQQAAARFTQRLTSAVALRLGYGLGSGSMAGLRSAVHHDLDIGLAFNRSFSFSPRTSLGFTSGSTVISVDNQRHFELVGSVQLRRLLSRRWSSALEYQRGLTAVDSLPRPYVASTVNGDIGGFLGSRVKVSVQPRYSWGADIADANRTFHSVIAMTRVDTAVNRHWAIFAEHFFYDYQFAAAPDLPATLAAGMKRQGLRWGLALWKPLR